LKWEPKTESDGGGAKVMSDGILWKLRINSKPAKPHSAGKLPLGWYVND